MIFGNITNKFKFNFLNNIKNVFLNKPASDLMLNIYDILIQSDMSISTADKIIHTLKNKNISTESDLLKSLADILYSILIKDKNSLKTMLVKPHVVLLVGVNGVGKTTTAVKIANLFSSDNLKVVVAACDTFRPAAVQQLDYLVKNTNIFLFKPNNTTDSVAVAFDAIVYAKSDNFDIVVIDTAGRLENNESLMLNLKRLIAVLKKHDLDSSCETVMVLDSTFGQNVISQVKMFSEYLKINSMCITKLDGTSKAGFIFSITDMFNIRVKYACFGENVTDIKLFDPRAYVDDLLKIDV